MMTFSPGSPPTERSKATGTLAAATLRLPIVALLRRGIDPLPLLAEIGVDPAVLEDHEARVPASAAFRAFERAVSLARDETLFLRIADALPMGTLDALDFAVRSSSTVGEALERLCRWYRYIDDVCDLDLRVDEGIARLVGRRRDRASPRHATEALFAIVMSRCSDVAGAPFPLKAVWFVGTPPRDFGAYARFFGDGVDLQFGQLHNELVFDAAWLDVRASTNAGAPRATGRLDEKLGDVIDRMTATGEAPAFLDRVRRATAAAIRGREPLLHSTAKRLGTTPRILQRQLAEQDTSYRRIVDQVRRQLAHELLTQTSSSIAEIGYVLGFTDARAFHHAFLRWTAMTPSTYRARACSDR